MWLEDLRSQGCDLSRPPIHVVDLVTGLLRIADANQPSTRQDRRNPNHGDNVLLLQTDLEAIASDICKNGRTELLARSRIEAILERLDGSPLPRGLAALSAAETFDAHFGSAFVDYFRGERPVAPRDPIPVLPFTLDELEELVDRPTGQPSYRTEADDRVSHLRLAPPDVTGFPVRMIWAEPELPGLSAATRFGAAPTNEKPLTELEWDSYEAGGKQWFYQVRPKSAETQAAVVTSAIQRAAETSVTFLVLPELSLTSALAEQVAELAALREVPVVAAGSFHTPKAHGQRNVCALYAYGEEVASHDKFTDFHFDDSGERRHEHLDPSAGFPLIISPKCTLAFVICKDALDARVARLIQQLAPRITLIPALSAEVDGFEQLAGSLARDPQGMTLVACSGGSSGAILGTPRKASPVLLHPGSKPQLVVFSAKGLVAATDLP